MLLLGINFLQQLIASSMLLLKVFAIWSKPQNLLKFAMKENIK